MSKERRERMFKVGEYVVYGHNGVCRITKIGPLETVAKDKDRLYYTLIPFGETGSTVFAPVDSQKIPMRKIISKEEALLLMVRNSFLLLANTLILKIFGTWC